MLYCDVKNWFCWGILLGILFFSSVMEQNVIHFYSHKKRIVSSGDFFGKTKRYTIEVVFERENLQEFNVILSKISFVLCSVYKTLKNLHAKINLTIYSLETKRFRLKNANLKYRNKPPHNCCIFFFMGFYCFYPSRGRRWHKVALKKLNSQFCVFYALKEVNEGPQKFAVN